MDAWALQQNRNWPTECELIDEGWLKRSEDQHCLSDAGCLPRHTCAAQV